MSEKLKPCPFCGGNFDFEGALITERLAHPPSAICKKCGFRFVGNIYIPEPDSYLDTMEKLDDELRSQINHRPAEEALQKRIAELEAERDRLREALQIIASGHFSGTVELVNTEEMKTVWKSDVGLPMTVSEARDIARKALEGIGK